MTDSTKDSLIEMLSNMNSSDVLRILLDYHSHSIIDDGLLEYLVDEGYEDDLRDYGVISNDDGSEDEDDE